MSLFSFKTKKVTDQIWCNSENTSALSLTATPSRGGFHCAPLHAGTKLKVVPTLLRPVKSSHHSPSVCLQHHASPGLRCLLPVRAKGQVSPCFQPTGDQEVPSPQCLLAARLPSSGHHGQVHPAQRSPWVVILTGKEACV